MAMKFGLPIKLVEAIENELKKDFPVVSIVSINAEEDEIIFKLRSLKKADTLSKILERINLKDFCPEPTCPYAENKTFDARHEPCIACVCIPEE